MLRELFAAAAITALALGAPARAAADGTTAGAEDSRCRASPQALSGRELAELADISARSEELLAQSAGDGEYTVARVAPRGLTEDELRALGELSIERPELAEQSGGYISNDTLVTILVVILVLLLIPGL